MTFFVPDIFWTFCESLVSNLETKNHPLLRVQSKQKPCYSANISSFVCSPPDTFYVPRPVEIWVGVEGHVPW